MNNSVGREGVFQKIVLALFLLVAGCWLLATGVYAADNVFTDNIGIGRSAPQAKLDIRSTGTTTGFALRIANSLAADKLVVLDNGNVGIGTTAPSEKVTVAGGNLLQTSVATPRLVSSITDATKLNYASCVQVSGNYAYIAAYKSNYLTVVDISNPASPVIVGSLLDATNLGGLVSVYVSGKYAYIAANTSAIQRLTIVDVSNPTSPRVTGSVNDATNLNGSYNVTVSGKYAYVACLNGNRLTVVDVSNPSSPFVTGSITHATNLSNPAAVSVSGKYAYVAVYTGDRVTVVDVSIPASPVIVGTVTDATRLNGATSIYVSGRYAYVAAYTGSRLTIVDISNAVSPFVVSSLNDATNLNGANSVHTCGKYAYLAVYGGNRLAVVDVSNPAVSPRITGVLNDATNLNNANAIYVAGKYAYVSCWTGNRFTIVDISGIDAPSASIGNIATGSLSVRENADVTGSLSVGSGLNIGQGGIFSAGPLAIFATHTGTAAVLDIRKPSSSASNPIMQITSTGNVGIGLTNPAYQLQLSLDSAGKPNGGNWAIVSDLRLKKNIMTIDHALDKMLALRGVEFAWKDPASQGNFTGRAMGFIAQEAEKVIPYWVGTDPRGYKDITIGGFEALAVEAVRELKQECDETKKKSTELVERARKLEARLTQ